VNWADLWGLRPLMQGEIELHKAAGGRPVDYSSIDLVNGKPSINDVRGAAEALGKDTSGYSDSKIQSIMDGTPAMSLPNGKIYVPDDARGTGNPNDQNALIAHEIEHQAQYTNGINGSTEQIFGRLVDEAFQAMDTNKPDPYRTQGYLEYEAQKVENRALELLNNGWSPSQHTSSTLKEK